MKLQVIAIALLASLSAFAQEQNVFTVDAQLRTRGEYNGGALNPRYQGQKAALFINERARIGLGYQRGALQLKVAGQHTGVWGQDDIKDRYGRFALNEAWAKMSFGPGFFAQVGRQQLSYDDERLLGGLDWNVAGNWHDALRAGYEGAADRVHLIFAWNQTAENNRGNYYAGPMPYKMMQTAWYHHKFEVPVEFSLLFMNVGREGKNGVDGHGVNRHQQTFGFHVTSTPDQFDLAASFYYQTGKDAANRKLSALMAAARVGYRFDSQWHAHVGYDFLSGEDYGADAKANRSYAFNPLFGTHHKFYGSMDYFYASTMASGLAPGLHDVQLGVDFKPCKTSSLQLTYHYFAAASDLNRKRSLGHEIDLQFSARLMKDVTLMGGYSFMLGTSTMDVVKLGNHKSWQDWAWISLNINPRLLTTKW